MPTSEPEPREHRFLREFAAHEPAIRAYVRRLVPSRADADDITQEVAVLLWKKFPEFREGGSFRAWAYGIARYEVLAWMRDRGRDRLILDEEVVGKIADESAEADSRLARQREALGGCIQRLPGKQRAAVLRAYQPKASIREIAAAEGRSVAGFYQWLYRVRRRLMECIENVLAKEGNP